MKRLYNPIIPGFYPDPSVVCVDDTFYMVHSSFEYMPAIPIWMSKDLRHWKQIGHAITREEQGLSFDGVMPSGGVQAATIRYHQGTYYISSTRINDRFLENNNHFILTAKDPAGPWSKCHFIDNAPGIDSALYFEGERAYFIANRPSTSDPASPYEIWIQEIDLKTMTLIGPSYGLWRGTGGVFPEGPRLYKKDDTYILLIAEGGTLHHHAVTIATSKHIFGPYESSKLNPHLTHRHLNRTYSIQNVGHADIFQTSNLEYYAVLLGSRPRGGLYDDGNVIYSFGGYYRNLGRETFIVPVTWEHPLFGPLFSSETGKVEASYELPNLKEYPLIDQKVSLSESSIQKKWVSIKKLPTHVKSLSNNQMQLTLQETIEKTFFGSRQTSWNMSCHMTFHLETMHEGAMIGFVAYMTEASYIGIQIKKENGFHVSFVEKFLNNLKVTSSFHVKVKMFQVSLRSHDQAYQFTCNDQSETLNGKLISPDLNDTHTGVIIGVIGHDIKHSQVRVTLNQWEAK